MLGGGNGGLAKVQGKGNGRVGMDGMGWEIMKLGDNDKRPKVPGAKVGYPLG